MKEDVSEKNNNVWLNQFNDLILKNLKDASLTNARLAEELSISERKLYRIIEKHTGKTPNHYIRDIRLEQAHKMLNSGQFLSVKEVVHQVGFIKGDYFTQLFKHKYGITPVEILKRIGVK